MLKREITYEDFNGESATDIFYFNISKPELIEMDVEHEEGMGAWLKRVVATKDHKSLLKEFKELVLLAYGQKSDDGKRFVKSDQIREEFSQTAAYQELFMELATNDGAAAEFLIGALPKDMTTALEQSIETTTAVDKINPPI